MATSNSISMNDRWKSTKQALLISTNTSKHTNLNITNKSSKLCSRRVIKNLKGKTILLILKRNNEQFKAGVRNNQTISTISPPADTIVRYNSQHSSKISETTSIDHLNIDANRSNSWQSLEVQEAFSGQAIRSLPNILRSQSVKLKYKEQNLENSRDYQYKVLEKLQCNSVVLKHACGETHQATATEEIKVYARKCQNKRKQVHKPFSIKQQSPKWISENERNEETEFKGNKRSGGSKRKDIFYNGNFKEINMTIASYDENKLRIDKVKTGQAVGRSSDSTPKSEMCIEQEFCSSRSTIDQGNIKSHDFLCTSNQNEITGIQSELCIPNYTDFLGIGNYFAASDEVHKLLHPTLDDYTENADRTNNDTDDLDLLIRNDCAEQHREMVIINNDICEEEEANNIMKDADSSIENTFVLGYSHGTYYTEANLLTNHLNFSTNFRTTCTKYKRRRDKIEQIKTLRDVAILPKEPPASLRCNRCSKIYSKLGSLKKHIELHENFRLTCKRCSKTFREKVDFTRHVGRKCHNANTL